MTGYQSELIYLLYAGADLSNSEIDALPPGEYQDYLEHVRQEREQEKTLSKEELTKQNFRKLLDKDSANASLNILRLKLQRYGNYSN